VSGFMGLGGSAAKTDRKYEVSGLGGLQNIFNFGTSVAKSTLGGAADYWTKLLSGNRPAMSQAVAPETNAAMSTADAQKRQLATSGTARGGGTAATSQTMNDKVRAMIDNLLFGARPEAAKQSGALGEGALSTSTDAASNLAKTASDSRLTSNALTQQTIGQIASVASTILKGLNV
jgi:hypothetical protein